MGSVRRLMSWMSLSSRARCMCRFMAVRVFRNGRPLSATTAMNKPLRLDDCSQIIYVRSASVSTTRQTPSADQQRHPELPRYHPGCDTSSAFQVTVPRTLRLLSHFSFSSYPPYCSAYFLE
ncbi:unnamed protein product [Heligmosomoides polygyrus]|uniref:Secreted protein n=1 Tax=Heligmosomoides polygyrus TaxID=6339 RepID=A0A183FTT4_HELPZ|nr:unnamed protein product [Heligmosomoides polygyrus]